MKKYMLLWFMTAAVLLCHSAVYAENDSLFHRVSSYSWFKELTEDQKAWLKKASIEGLKAALPVEVTFYSLSKSFTLYKTPKLEAIVKQYQAIPSAVGHKSVVPNTKGEFAGNLDAFTLQKISGDRLLISYKETTGWIKRSTVRMDSLIITRDDGSYARDLFPNYRVRGNRARFAIASMNDACYFVVRYVKNYRSENEKYFGFMYDFATNRIKDIVEWKESGATIVKQQSLEKLVSPKVIDTLVEQVGLGKKGYIRFTTGKLKEGTMFYVPVSKKNRAVLHGKHLIIVAFI